MNGLNLEQAKLVASCAPIVPLIVKWIFNQAGIYRNSNKYSSEVFNVRKSGQKKNKSNQQKKNGKPLFLRIITVAIQSLEVIMLRDLAF